MASLRDRTMGLRWWGVVVEVVVMEELWLVVTEEDVAVVVAWFMVNVGWWVLVVASMADLCWLLVWSWVFNVGVEGGTSLLPSVVGAASEMDSSMDADTCWVKSTASKASSTVRNGIRPTGRVGKGCSSRPLYWSSLLVSLLAWIDFGVVSWAVIVARTRRRVVVDL